MEVKNIVLVDPVEIFRAGLRALLGQRHGLQVLMEFDSLPALVQTLPFKHEVHLLILEPELAGMDLATLAEAIGGQPEWPPLLILSDNGDAASARRYFRLGARGYLHKGHSVAELQQAIAALLDGGYHHNDYLAVSLLPDDMAPPARFQQRNLQRMSLREREFLRWVCSEAEYTYEQIADLMQVQRSTVEGYRQSLFEKFGIRSKAGLVLFGIKHGLGE